MPLTLHILHSLPGRVRFSFSRPVDHVEKLTLQVMEHEGIETMRYATATQTMLVLYDEKVVELQEILIRTAVSFSLENQLMPVQITQKSAKEFITPKGLMAGIGILVAGAITLLAPQSVFRKPLDWLSALATSAAVLEHAAYDYRKKGSVDPEVLSLVFLANRAMAGGNLLLPSVLTWIATFGRHFSPKEDEGVLLAIRKTGDKSRQYEIDVSKLDGKGGYLDMLNLFAEKFLSAEAGFDNTIFEKSKKLLSTHRQNLEGLGEKASQIRLHFNN